MILINAAQPAALFGLSRRCDSLTTPPESPIICSAEPHAPSSRGDMFERVDDLIDDLLDEILVIAFGHDADHRLGSR